LNIIKSKRKKKVDKPERRRQELNRQEAGGKPGHEGEAMHARGI
jgi:hypothetical protein